MLNVPPSTAGRSWPLPPTVLLVQCREGLLCEVAECTGASGCRLIPVDTRSGAVRVLVSDPAVRILIGDVPMPTGKEGFELAKWVRHNFPAVKVILTCGRRRLRVSITKLQKALGRNPSCGDLFDPALFPADLHRDRWRT